MNTNSPTNQLPLRLLFLRGVEESRKPHQGNGYCPAIVQHDREFFVRTRNINGEDFTAGYQSRHSISPRIYILFHELPNDGQLVATKPAVRCQVDGIEPEFRITANMCHVDVRWFPIFQTEEESVATNPEQYRHSASLHLID